MAVRMADASGLAHTVVDYPASHHNGACGYAGGLPAEQPDHAEKKIMAG